MPPSRRVRKLGEEAVESAADGLHRHEGALIWGGEEASQGGFRGGGRLADEVGAQCGGKEPDASHMAGLGAVTEEGLDPDDEIDPQVRGLGGRVEAGDACGEGVGADLAAGAGLTRGAGGGCGGIEGGTDRGEGLQRQDRGELAGAVVEGTAGDPPIRAGAAVAAGLCVGSDREAGAAYGLAQPHITQAGEPRGEVVIDLLALLGREVRDLAGDRERAVLGQLTSSQGSQRLGEVVTQSTRQQHPLLPRVGAGQGREGELRADRDRSRWRATPRHRNVLGVGGISERGSHHDLRCCGRGLDPLQRLELVEVLDWERCGSEVREEVSEGVQISWLPRHGGRLRRHPSLLSTCPERVFHDGSGHRH